MEKWFQIEITNHLRKWLEIKSRFQIFPIIVILYQAAMGGNPAQEI